MFTSWFYLFRYFSLFKGLAFYYFLTNKTIVESRAFLAVFFGSLIPFSHVNYILNSQREFRNEDETLINYFAESEFISSIFQQYFFSLGDFFSDNFNSFGKPQNKWILWAFLSLSTLISTVTMLNMLVTIMGDVFGRYEPFRKEIAVYMLF